MGVVAVRCGLLLALVGCSFQPGELMRDAPIEIDAMIDAPIPLGPWGTPTPVLLPPPTDTDDDPTLTGDRLEMYINSQRDGNADIYVVTRAMTSVPWSPPTLVPLVSTNANETTPEVSADGLTLIVASDRPGTLGSNDLWLATRGARMTPWSDPVHLVELATASNEAAGNLTSDGRMIVFSSTKLNGSPDLFYATRAAATGTFGEPVEITAVNTGSHEGSPCISADGLTLYFDSDRDGDMDLYVATRGSRDEPFPAAQLITELASGTVDADPWISPDNRHLFFASNRSGTYQLWEATR